MYHCRKRAARGKVSSFFPPPFNISDVEGSHKICAKVQFTSNYKHYCWVTDKHWWTSNSVYQSNSPVKAGWEWGMQGTPHCYVASGGGKEEAVGKESKRGIPNPFLAPSDCQSNNLSRSSSPSFPPEIPSTTPPPPERLVKFPFRLPNSAQILASSENGTAYSLYVHGHCYVCKKGDTANPRVLSPSRHVSQRSSPWIQFIIRKWESAESPPFHLHPESAFNKENKMYP